MNLFLVCIIDFSEMLLFLFEIVKIIKFDQVVYDISIYIVTRSRQNIALGIL